MINELNESRNAISCSTDQLLQATIMSMLPAHLITDIHISTGIHDQIPAGTGTQTQTQAYKLKHIELVLDWLQSYFHYSYSSTSESGTGPCSSYDSASLLNICTAAINANENTTTHVGMGPGRTYCTRIQICLLCVYSHYFCPKALVCFCNQRSNKN